MVIGDLFHIPCLGLDYATPFICFPVTKMHFIKGGSGLVTILDDMFGTEGTMDFLKDNFFEVIAEFSCEYL